MAGKPATERERINMGGLAEGEERWTISHNEWAEKVDGPAVAGVVVVRASRFEEVQQEAYEWKLIVERVGIERQRASADLERAQEENRQLKQEWENLEASQGYDVEALAEARERGEGG